MNEKYLEGEALVVGVTSLLVILSRYNFLLKKIRSYVKNTTTEEVPRLSPAPTGYGP